MKQLQKLTAMLTILCLLPVLLPVTASAEVITGKCGEDVFYTLDFDSKTLTITGKGEMDALPEYNDSWETHVWAKYGKQIETVIIGQGVTNVEEQAFEYFSELTRVELPDTVTTIGYHAFNGCAKLKDIRLPSHLKSVGAYAFGDCTSLETLTLPKTVTVFPSTAVAGPYYGCTSLTAIDVEAGNPAFCSRDGVLFNRDCSILICYPAGRTQRSYTVPAEVQYISSEAFYGCSALQTVESAGSIKKIGSSGFAGCTSLKSVKLGSARQKTDDVYRFGGCKKLQKVYYDYDHDYFRDVKGDAYYAEAVRWASKYGVTAGIGDDRFLPSGGCTRDQIVTFLWRIVGNPDTDSGQKPFTDVNWGNDYAKAVSWAIENGITTGTSKTTFSPFDTCTRAQIVTFLWRFAGEPEPAGNDQGIAPANPFTDVAESKYYYKAVLWAVENGITTGTSADKFSPHATCTRAQAVTFLYRADSIAEKDGLFDKSCYEIVLDNVNWNAARAAAAAKGGKLVTFDNADEYRFVLELIQTDGDPNGYYFVGAQSDPDRIHYYWLDRDGNLYGGPLNVYASWCNALWQDGEPSFAWENQPETVAILYDSPQEGRWCLYDGSASLLTDGRQYGYIIEYP